MGGDADGGSDDGAGPPPAPEVEGDTAEYPEAVARAVRRASLLIGLVPLADMTAEEVAWVFEHLAGY